MKKTDIFYDENLFIQESKFIKRIVKKIIRKGVYFIFRPYVAFQNKVNAVLLEQNLLLKKELENMIVCMKDEVQNTYLEMQSDILHREHTLQELVNKLAEETKHNLGAMSRLVISTKWMSADALLKETDDDYLTCRICGHSQRRGEYVTKEADCIFHGGHLKRYICPKCGVVFGPTKFSGQSQQQIDDDYTVHYLGFSEGDSSKKEERAFYMLYPTKEGVYLNYGCGHWSKSLQELRNRGYQVYGYEPYAPDMKNPFMVSSKEALSRMQFDGIYSNDLLEHLLDPVEELKFMRTLLLNGDSKMAHSTSCYIYKYEYTRFHIHFFLGNSLSILAENSGFHIVDSCNDVKQNDFICYVFATNDKRNLLDRMFLNEKGIRDAYGKVVLESKGILFGPYLNLGKRRYTLEVRINGCSETSEIKITSRYGKKILETGKLLDGINQIIVDLDAPEKDVEFVIENENRILYVEAIYLY